MSTVEGIKPLVVTPAQVHKRAVLSLLRYLENSANTGNTQGLNAGGQVLQQLIDVRLLKIVEGVEK